MQGDAFFIISFNSFVFSLHSAAARRDGKNLADVAAAFFTIWRKKAKVYRPGTCGLAKY